MVKRLSNTDQNSNKITNVPTPVDNGDAVNKEYADTKGDVKGPASVSPLNPVAFFDGTTGKLIKQMMSGTQYVYLHAIMETLHSSAGFSGKGAYIGELGLEYMSEETAIKVLADLDMQTLGINNLAAPVDPNDAATKAYVDANAGGGGSAWIPVTVGTAATTVAKTGTTTGGTYTPATGDRLLVTFNVGININNPTLNIDGSGVKNIRLGNVNISTAIIGTTSLVVLPMFYDGTAYQMFGSTKNDNTTYSSITSTEIDAGNSTTARAMTGAAAGYIINKARLGVIKSDTIVNANVSATAPVSPQSNDIWFDTSSLPDALAPSTIVWKETPSGSVNGINFAFQTAQPYQSGTLQGFINGYAQSGKINETGPGSGTFEFDIAPETGDDVKVQYQIRSTELGNAQSLGNVSLGGLLEALYPVGSVYVSGSSTMPALIAGVGTWTRLKGRMIIGVDEDQVEFDTINETGGLKTHRHKGYGDGDGLGNGDLRATIGSAAAEANTINFQALDALNPNTGSGLGNGTYAVAGTNTGSKGFSHYTKVVGYTSTQTSLPPYKAKFMWERTA